jgi:hypothetical protein
LHLPQESIGNLSHLSASSTGATGLYRIFILCTRTTTAGASCIFFNLDRFVGALGNLLIIHLQLDAKVAAPGSPGPATTTTLATTAATKKASENIVSENISKIAENIIHVHALPTTKSGATAVHSGMAIPIILGTFFLVAEYLIGLSSFLEFFLSGLVARISVRMELHGHLAVGFLDLIR